jgi:hypothetical protein
MIERPGGELTPDVNETIRIACYHLRLASSAAYDGCLKRERAAVGASPLPDLGILPFTDAFTSRVACMSSRIKGVTSYHKCLAKEVADAVTHPSPNLTTKDAESLLEARTSCMRARPLGNTVYNSCLSRFAPTSGRQQDERVLLETAP